MRHAFLLRTARYTTVSAVLVAVAGCTMKSQEPPDFTGPSELGKSVTVAASPDILAQDGMSRSNITVAARGPNGEPLPGESMVVDIWVAGSRVEFGTLSQRNITTGSDGRATFVYTAPPSPPLSTVQSIDVTIAVTPIGTDFGNSRARIATIRVVPIGTVAPPDGLAPHFTFSPDSPAENQQVLFSACNDSGAPVPCAPADNPIAEYEWDFGDGSGGGGQFATHAYSTSGFYTVTLTIIDHYGRRASTARQVAVAAGTGPTAAFTFSPSDPKVGQTIAFNAAGSTAAAGHQIVRHEWDFGDGSGLQTGQVTMNRTYPTAGSYNVTLVVTDDTGKKSSTSVAVTVTP